MYLRIDVGFSNILAENWKIELSKVCSCSYRVVCDYIDMNVPIGAVLTSWQRWSSFWREANFRLEQPKELEVL